MAVVLLCGSAAKELSTCDLRQPEFLICLLNCGKFNNILYLIKILEFMKKYFSYMFAHLFYNNIMKVKADEMISIS